MTCACTFHTVMPAQAGIHDFRMRGQAVVYVCVTKDGLLRSARNDEVGSFADEKQPSCRRKLASTTSLIGNKISQAIGWKLHIWCKLPYQVITVSLVLLFGIPAATAADNNKPIRHSLTANISNLTPLKLHPGLNHVEFWGQQQQWDQTKSYAQKNLHDVTAQNSGVIFMATVDYTGGAYMASANWHSSYDLLQLTQDSYTVTDSLCSYCGSFQTVLFAEGILNNHRQTFLIIAQRQPVREADGDGSTNVDPEPTLITIYGFHDGSRAKYNPNEDESPGFIPVDKFLANQRYCDSFDAIILELKAEFASSYIRNVGKQWQDGRPFNDHMACAGE